MSLESLLSVFLIIFSLAILCVPFFYFFFSFYMSHLLLRILSYFTWITSGLIGLFFYMFFIMNRDFWDFLTVQVCPPTLYAVVPSKCPILMWGLLRNHQELLESYLEEVQPLWDLPRQLRYTSDMTSACNLKRFWV